MNVLSPCHFFFVLFLSTLKFNTTLSYATSVLPKNSSGSPVLFFARRPPPSAFTVFAEIPTLPRASQRSRRLLISEPCAANNSILRRTQRDGDGFSRKFSPIHVHVVYTICTDKRIYVHRTDRGGYYYFGKFAETRKTRII